MQIRSSINTMLFSQREFSWVRHMLIAAFILLFNNLLVIFVPTIRDIFGFIGESSSTIAVVPKPIPGELRGVQAFVPTKH